MNPKVILDSGAYTAHRKGMEINIDEYAKHVIKHQDEYLFCFNLDVINDSQKSYENWEYLNSLGAKTIPVYHMGTGEEQWLKKYLDKTDHIAIGAIATLNTKLRVLGLDNIWKTYFVDKNSMPKVKVHGLGLTDIELMVRYPWNSVDSFTPVISAIWGNVLLPKVTNDGKKHYFDMFICRISDQGTHRVGMQNSFTNIPKRSKDVYLEMFEKEGFNLGKIEYQERRDRRGKKGEGEKHQSPLFDIVEPSDPNDRTLANMWEERMRWNLTMWNYLKERLPIYPRPLYKTNDELPPEKISKGKKTIMSMGVSTVTHLEIFNTVEPKLDILISYAYLTKNVYKAIRKYVK